MAVVCKAVIIALGTVVLKSGSTLSLCHARNREGSVCPRSNHIEIKFKPYYETIFDKTGSNKSLYPQVLRNASLQCCNTSTIQFVPVNRTSADIEELIKEESCEKDEHKDARLTFFFPVFVKRGKKVVFDDEFQFLQLTKSPGPVIMMLTSEKEKMKVTASEAVRENWPLFVLILSLALTVGLLGWFLEHLANPLQFSSWFYQGAWEGFWWAMVTITTIGYGDKVPITFLARILTIIWMFCGAIILSLFTANVASVLTSNQVDNSKDLIGLKIAVLNSKHYFEYNLNVGGTIEEFNSEQEIYEKLEKMEVDRVLIPSYLDIVGMQKDNHKRPSLSIVDVIYEPFLLGLALANQANDQDKAFLSCLQKKVNNFHMVTTKKVFPKSQDTQHRTTMLFERDIVLIVYYNLIAIGVIAGVGVFLDLIRCCRPNRSRKKSLADDNEMRNLDSNV